MIRDIHDRDIDRVTQIYNHYIRSTLISFEKSEIDSSIMLARVTKARNNALPWLVADVEDNVVGYCYAAPWHERSAYDRSVEVTVYLDQHEVGQGYGAQLYAELFSRLKNKGIHTAIGVIALPNPGSIALHEKCGFKKVGQLKDIGLKNGEWVDVGYWQLVFSCAE